MKMNGNFQCGMNEILTVEVNRKFGVKILKNRGMKEISYNTVLLKCLPNGEAVPGAVKFLSINNYFYISKVLQEGEKINATIFRHRLDHPADIYHTIYPSSSGIHFPIWKYDFRYFYGIRHLMHSLLKKEKIIIVGNKYIGLKFIFKLVESMKGSFSQLINGVAYSNSIASDELFHIIPTIELYANEIASLNSKFSLVNLNSNKCIGFSEVPVLCKLEEFIRKSKGQQVQKILKMFKEYCLNKEKHKFQIFSLPKKQDLLFLESCSTSFKT